MNKSFPFLLVFAASAALCSCADATRDSSSAATDSSAASATPVEMADTSSPIITSVESSGIPAGTAGVWVEDASRVDAAGADAEAAITLCESGRASYAVFSNQLFVFMKVTRSASGSGDVFSFYFDGEDVGSGLRNAGLHSPAPSTLLGTGRVEGEGAGVLTMDWSAGEEYIKSIRAAAPKAAGRTVFPQKFYHNFIAMAGLCEETE